MASPSRGDLQNLWRNRLQLAWLRYETASAAFRTTWEEHVEEQRLPGDPTFDIQSFRKEESEALAEYSRLLRAFKELLLYGKIPEEPSKA